MVPARHVRVGECRVADVLQDGKEAVLDGLAQRLPKVAQPAVADVGQQVDVRGQRRVLRMAPLHSNDTNPYETLTRPDGI